jgi:hypothetical protein
MKIQTLVPAGFQIPMAVDMVGEARMERYGFLPVKAELRMEALTGMYKTPEEAVMIMSTRLGSEKIHEQRGLH